MKKLVGAALVATLSQAASADSAQEHEMMARAVGYQYPDYSGDNPPPPSQRVHMIILGVDDIQKSTQFYSALGWIKTDNSNADFVRIDLGGHAIALLDRAKFGEEVLGHPVERDTHPYKGIAFAHFVRRPSEVPEVLARALRAGGTLVKPVTRTPWGINAFFKDPDGYLFEIDYEDSWVFDDDHHLKVGE
jgi:predicted lactoylglutathione lyase